MKCMCGMLAALGIGPSGVMFVPVPQNLLLEVRRGSGYIIGTLLYKLVVQSNMGP